MILKARTTHPYISFHSEQSFLRRVTDRLEGLVVPNIKKSFPERWIFGIFAETEATPSDGSGRKAFGAN